MFPWALKSWNHFTNERIRFFFGNRLPPYFFFSLENFAFKKGLADFFRSKRKISASEISPKRQKVKMFFFAPKTRDGYFLVEPNPFWAMTSENSVGLNIACSILKQGMSYLLWSFKTWNMRDSEWAQVTLKQGIRLPIILIGKLEFNFCRLCLEKVANLMPLIGCKHYLISTTQHQRRNLTDWVQYCHPFLADFCAVGRILK